VSFILTTWIVFVCL